MEKRIYSKINIQSLKKFKNSTSYYRKLKQRMKESCVCAPMATIPQKLNDHHGSSTGDVMASQNQYRQKEQCIDEVRTYDQIRNTIFVGDIDNAMATTISQNSLTQNYNNIEETIAADESNFSDDDDGLFTENEDNSPSLLVDLRSWALNGNITHTAITQLLNLLRRHIKNNQLPNDARTLLATPKTVTISQMGNGEYWHQGLKACLENSLRFLEDELPSEIVLMFNIDGLPIYNSSKKEFWPILCKVDNLPNLEPMVIGIYCGEGKPAIGDFLTPFAVEMSDILNNGGIDLTSRKLAVKIKCFVCDTPARAFVKGTVNFNHYHGCTKCIAIGEYYMNERHMSFPRTDLPKRNDAGFRSRQDPDHHREETPLEQLPIDMIEDFPVSDSLHLIDLGIMKRCLTGWVYGNYSNYSAKLSSFEINLITKFLLQSNKNMPTEIHRAVRGLDCLKFWKGLEYRTFLHYLGPVVLKDYLPSDIYTHFLMLFCAVTICSCKKYLSSFSSIAEKLFESYIEIYIDLYGEDSISSNVHNLCHIMDDVKRFGPLPSFSAYPFENKLYHIKRLLRNGRKPLSQVAKRILEHSVTDKTKNCTQKSYPILKNESQLQHTLPTCNKVFLKAELLDGLVIANSEKDKWFMTEEEDIIAMINVTYFQKKLWVYGSSIRTKLNFFEKPFNSSRLCIFMSDGKSNPPKLYAVHNIKCKLVSLPYKNNLIFFPLLHTLDLCNLLKENAIY